MSRRLSRRSFLKIATGSVLGLGLPAIGGTAYATRIEPDWVEVSEVTIPLPHLPPAFDGFTITQINDIHLGEWMTEPRLMSIVGRINELEPDIVAIPGDFVSAIWSGIPDLITRALGAFRPRHGVAASLGNHDHWTNASIVGWAIEQSGAWLMNNRSIELREGDSALYIVGVDDIWEEQHDLDAALRDVPQDAATVLLAHEPDYADEVAATGRIGLQLSGHSHGGQVRIPGIGAPLLPWLGEKYDMGLYEIEGMHLYVNRGVGMISPYVRFNCRPEITHFTLTVAE